MSEKSVIPALEMCSATGDHSITLPVGLKQWEIDKIDSLFQMKGGRYNSKTDNYAFPSSTGQDYLNDMLSGLIKKLREVESRDGAAEPARTFPDTVESVEGFFDDDEEETPEEEEPEETEEVEEETPEEEVDEEGEGEEDWILPPEVAEQLVKMAEISGLDDHEQRRIILVPHANVGEILNALVVCVPDEEISSGKKIVVCYLEEDSANRSVIADSFGDRKNFGDLISAGFTQYMDLETKERGGKMNAVNRIITARNMNYIQDDILHGLKLLVPGGRLVALIPAGLRHLSDSERSNFQDVLEQEASYDRTVSVSEEGWEDFEIIIIDK